jgi:hypothetical protein
MLQTKYFQWILFLVPIAFFCPNASFTEPYKSINNGTKTHLLLQDKNTKGNKHSTPFIRAYPRIFPTSKNNTTEFTIYNAWDFEDETPGAYTEVEIARDFDCSAIYTHNSSSIVIDTINGVVSNVLRVTHPANTLENGLEMEVKIGNDYDEIYLSFNWKFSEEFNSTVGGKLPGLIGQPAPPPNHFPENGEGFRATNMFKRAGYLISYHYDRTNPPEAPWAIDENVNDPLFLLNGVWYNITQRLVMNTFTNGDANSDGIKELWVNGLMIFQETSLKLMENESSTMKIDGFMLSNFYGGDLEEYMPLRECYGYIDNIKVYMPNDDPVSGYNLHSPSLILGTPDEITDRRVFYDSLRTTPGTLSNAEYGNTYSSCIDETYLIDAGDNNTVTYTWNHSNGTGDYLFFYDGNTSGATLLRTVFGNSDQSGQSVTSTGRYLFVRFSTDREEVSNGWTGTISFSNIPEDPSDETRSFIEAFPNPTRGIFKIILHNLGQQEVMICTQNILGHIIIKKHYTNLESKFDQSLDISNYPAGDYIISVFTNTAIYSQRIVRIL